MWKIPLFDIGFDKQEKEAVRQVLDSGWLTMGGETERFEQRFSEYMNVKHAIAVSNCTAALHLANLALGIGEGDEVICPSLSFVAGANSIIYTGAKPVFADVTGLTDFNISPDDIAAKISKKSKAIQILHYAGNPCNMSSIMEIADNYGLSVIEDCAHAVNSKYKGKRLGSIGDFSIYSFSKFAYCNVLGGVGFKNYEFNQFFNEHLKKSSKTLATIINLIKLLSTYNINRGGGKVVNLGLTNGLTSMAYSRYTDSLVPSRGSINMFEKQFKKECILRLENYQYIKEALDEYGVFEHLTGNISVIPYAVPLKLPLKISQRIVKKLRILGLETGIYNFDIDRFMPEPNFIKTILLPCHSNLSRTTISSMIDIIVSEIRA